MDRKRSQYTYEIQRSVEEQQEAHKRTLQKIFIPPTEFHITTPDRFLYGAFETTAKNDIRETLNTADRVVLGDAHGSALKILEVAVLSGMVDLPTDVAEEWREIYHVMATHVGERTSYTHPEKETLFTDQTGKEFFTLLQAELLKRIDTMRWNGGDRHLTLIGDVISDRGLSDIITMRLIRQLRETGGTVTVLAGNHDLESIAHTAAALHPTVPIPRMQYASQKESEIRSSTTIPPEILKQEQRYFFEHLKLFDYNPTTGTFYTHANFDLATLRDLARQLKMSPPTKPEEVPQFVDAANRWSHTIIMQTLDGQRSAEKTDIQLLMNLVWGREEYTSSREIPLSDVIKRFVHGHSYPQRISQAYNLRLEQQGETRAISIDDEYRKEEGAIGIHKKLLNKDLDNIVTPEIQVYVE